MNCDKIRELISPLIDGRLGPADAEAVREHLSGCKDCRTHMADLENTLEGLGALGRRNAPADLKARVHARLKAEIKAESPVAVKKSPVWLRPVFLARIAAVLVVGLLVGMFWALQVGQNENGPAMLSENDAAAAPDQAPAADRERHLGDIMTDPAAEKPEAPSPVLTRKKAPGFSSAKKDIGTVRSESSDDMIADMPAEKRTYGGGMKSKITAKGYAAESKTGRDAARPDLELNIGKAEEGLRGAGGAAKAPAAPAMAETRPGALKKEGTFDAGPAEGRIMADALMEAPARESMQNKADDMDLHELRIPAGQRERTLRFIDGLVASADKKNIEKEQVRAVQAAIAPQAPAPAPKPKAVRKAEADTEVLADTDTTADNREAGDTAEEAKQSALKTRRRDFSLGSREKQTTEILLTRQQYARLSAFIKGLSTEADAPEPKAPPAEAAFMMQEAEDKEEGAKQAKPAASKPAYTVLRIRITDIPIRAQARGALIEPE